MINYNVDKKGFYGDFGGAFVPEMLYPNLNELTLNYVRISKSKSEITTTKKRGW